MANLTAKQESFIKLMTENEELARRGFELLLKRLDYDQFFDALQKAGLFDPSHNPAPVPAEEKGYVRIPFWSVLTYLTAVARLSGERNDLPLANKVMTVLRSVASWRDPEGKHRENYHTAHKFAEILGLVPTEVLTAADLGFIPLWLKDRFERMLVISALDKGLLPRLLASESSQDWDKALLILRHCTATEWRHANPQEKTEGTPVTVADDFWLKELINHHAGQFGLRVGRKACEIFVERVREVFGGQGRKQYSQLYRPAIEDHFQNHEWQGAENRTVEGLRDVLTSWSEHEPSGAKPFVQALLSDPLPILRRIAIYTVDKQWANLSGLYAEFLAPSLFDGSHLHELYNLLTAHFAEMSEKERDSTVRAIREIKEPAHSTDAPGALKRIQQRWLSAIMGKGYEPADVWFRELQHDTGIAQPGEHADFDSYREFRWGPGATAYTVAELVAFAASGTLVEKINDFEERDPWRGPTMEGLAAALEEAVRTFPEPFVSSLHKFLKAKRRLQYSLITGLKQAWEPVVGNTKELDWEKLITFFEEVLCDTDFWPLQAREDVYRDWVASAIADCLHSGTQDDKHAYPANLLPRTQAVIGILLDKLRPVDRPSDDATTQAINTPKGRAVEALFSQALRACRVSDQSSGTHHDAWASIRGFFEAELDKCKNANYEFSTLCGNYLPQLDYMDRDWLSARIGLIFPVEYQSNSICAIDGLAYAALSKPVYSLLAERGILDRALRYELKGRNAREKLLERIAVAYSWGQESLESPRFTFVFDPKHVEDLETISRFFWMIRGQTLSEEQVERILRYFGACVIWAQGQREKPERLLSSLSMLSCYLRGIDGSTRDLLEAVAPYVYLGRAEYTFIEELLRLADQSPDSVSAVLGKMISIRAPDFDYKDQLKALLRKLADKGKKQDVLSYAEALRGIGGMQELFDELTRKH